MHGSGYCLGIHDDALYWPDRPTYLETRYKHLRMTYSDSGEYEGIWFDWSWNTVIVARLGEKLISDVMVETYTYGDGTSSAQPITRLLDNLVTWEGSVNEIAGLLRGAKNWSDESIVKAVSLSCSPSLSLYRVDFSAGPSRPYDITMKFARYRFGVPYVANDMPRSTFEAQWDIYSFPHGWLAWQATVETYEAAIIAQAEWVIEHVSWQIAQDFYDANIDAYYLAIDEWYNLSYLWDEYYYLYDWWTYYPEDFPEGEPHPPSTPLGPEPVPPPDPGPEPEEPAIPAEPDSWIGSPLNTCGDTGGPTFISSESWTWGGDMGMANEDPAIFAANPEQWSPWFDLPDPEIPNPLSDVWDKEGIYDCSREFLVCNMMTKCYHSAALGVAPTIHPPIYTPPAV